MSRLRLTIDLLLDLPQHVRRYVLSDALSIGGQHPDDPVPDLCIIDHPNATSLASTRQGPTELSHAARAGDERPGLRIGDQRMLKGRILVVRKILADQARKQPRLDKTIHARSIRHCRTEPTQDLSSPMNGT